MIAEPALSPEDIEETLKGITIPSPPQIIADLQMEMAMPEPDLNEMADMISKDPGLAGGVLKTLNSPYYGNRDIGSISQAVMMLGMTTVANIVNTLYIRDTFSENENISDGIYTAMNHFWDSATDVARACRLTATHIGRYDPDMCYMLGLFHNVGIPLLMKRFSNYPEILSQSYLLNDKRIVDTENLKYKTNHAVVSFYAARSWKLPEVLCRVIAEHHSAAEIFSDKDHTPTDEKAFLAILKLGEHLAGLSRIIGNNESDEEWKLIEEQVLDYLGLTKFDFEDLSELIADNGIGGKSYFM